jgi:hypothetical protein
MLVLEILFAMGYALVVVLTSLLPEFGFFIVMINLFVAILVFFGMRLSFLKGTERGIEATGDVVGYIMLLVSPIALPMHPILSAAIALLGLIVWCRRTIYELSLLSRLEQLKQDHDHELYWAAHAELYRENIKSHFELDE